MTRIDFSCAKQLAEDMQATQIAIDDAIANVATLTSSVVNVCKHSEIHPAKTQATMNQIADGFSSLIAARGGVVGAHRHINKVQRDSDLQAVDFGCERPLGPTTGKAANLTVVNS